MKLKAGGSGWSLLFLITFVLSAATPVVAWGQIGDSGVAIAPGDSAAAVTPAMLSGPELEELVGPVALYPDDLIAIVLPASTYPLQIVQAARFLDKLEAEPTIKPDEAWDDTVTALLNYPEVVDLLNDKIDWTWRLGEAVVVQQDDVVAAIEAFRDKAYAAGNLQSDEYQTVSKEDEVIEISPANKEVIYVPYYEPEQVVVYQTRPVYHYYPAAYPLYYYPYPAYYSFRSDFFWGVTTAYTVGWLTNRLHVHHHSYLGHPYYGHHYNGHHYRRPALYHHNNSYVHNSRAHSGHRYRDGDYWRPQRSGGARPGYHQGRVHYYGDRTRKDRYQGGRSGNRMAASGSSHRVDNRSRSGASIRNSVSLKLHSSGKAGRNRVSTKPVQAGNRSRPEHRTRLTVASTKPSTQVNRGRSKISRTTYSGTVKSKGRPVTRSVISSVSARSIQTDRTRPVLVKGSGLHGSAIGGTGSTRLKPIAAVSSASLQGPRPQVQRSVSRYSTSSRRKPSTRALHQSPVSGLRKGSPSANAPSRGLSRGRERRSQAR
ncbi:MAG: DUF3300 domain-containing protein [Halieaceae bacterium]|nr:DUF3300 domain-containing protein [Halieaceae bacterium]